MALTTAQKHKIIAVYKETEYASGKTLDDMVTSIGMIVLNNPTTAQKTALRTIVEAKKTASETTEAGVPAQQSAIIAALDAEQAELAAIITELS